MGEGKRGILNQGYGIMPNKVLFDKELSDKAKLLFCFISSLCAEKGFCRAGNEYISERMGMSERTVREHIGILAKHGYITLVVEKGNQRKITVGVVAESCHGDGENSPSSDGENLPHNITNTNITNNKENKKRKFLEFVYLTDEEYNKLIDSYGERVIKEQIKNLNNYIGQNGKDKYKSHYYTILNWNRKAGIKEIPKRQENETGIYDLPF